MVDLWRWILETGTGENAVAVGWVGPQFAFDEVEAACVAHSVAKRVNEFRTGRELARLALQKLGHPPVRNPLGPAREPAWPVGFVGAISHSDTICIVHVGRLHRYAGIGLDIEPNKPLEPELVPLVASSEEWEAIRRSSVGDMDPGKVCFSAKEAFYKAYFPTYRTYLDFTDVHLTVDWDEASFQITLINPEKPSFGHRRTFKGRFTCGYDHIVTSMLVSV